MIDFGKGLLLREVSKFLCDDEERHRRILEVVERDSVIEGLPPFTAETRQRILNRLKMMNVPFEEQSE